MAGSVASGVVRSRAEGFSDGRGLVDCLVPTFEGIDRVGMLGGNLRALYADFLDEASRLTGSDYHLAAAAYRNAAERWSEAVSVMLRRPRVAETVDADRRRRRTIDEGDDTAAAVAGPESETANRSTPASILPR